LVVFVDMASYSTSEFRPGLKIMLDGDPCAIVESEFVKPGKGQAFHRVKLRNLRTDRVWSRTFRSGESIEAADVLDVNMQFLYQDGDFWHFMKQDGSYEQSSASSQTVGDAARWLQAEDLCEVTLWNGTPITVTPPRFVELEVIETDPGLRGDTAQGGSKPARLATGTIVRVPLFVNVGDLLRIDTRAGEYQSRVQAR